MKSINNLIFGILALVFLSSCSSSNLLDYSTTCLCKVTENFSASTDEEDNSTKEFIFTNSPLFKLGVLKYDFALNMAILINQDIKIDSLTTLKITVDKGNSNIKSYKFYSSELKNMTPKHTEIHNIISSFVENTYTGDFHKCKENLGFDIEDEKLNSIMTKIKKGLNHEYVQTKMISFKKTRENIYHIYGGILTSDETLDLFKMQFKE
ncbi:hypothetical protein [Lentimicrobium sp. S6]|nr:hypothetical protein [Lentimicrobium sp. S6]NPD48256.1 hypothetical protein [Lentimicrobium sp. S6]